MSRYVRSNFGRSAAEPGQWIATPMEPRTRTGAPDLRRCLDDPADLRLECRSIDRRGHGLAGHGTIVNEAVTRCAMGARDAAPGHIVCVDGDGAGARGRDRRWHHRLQRGLPPGPRRLDGRAARRKGAVDGRIHLPGGWPGHGLQSVVDDDGVPSLQHRALSRARGLRDGREPSLRVEPGSVAGAPADGQPGARDRTGCRGHRGR